MQAKRRLLMPVLQRYKTHARSRHCFADRSRSAASFLPRLPDMR
jgi:hypothetical protein